jgi:membrane-associated phospholipid phosphatase
MYNKIRDSIFWSSIRATPLIYFIYGLFNILIDLNLNNTFYILAYTINFVSNGIFKITFKKLYDILNTDYIFPFGQGSRPIGATNCGIFSVSTNPSAISFGMPSGHSQMAWFFSTYFILKIINNDLVSNDNKYIYLKNVRIGLLLFIAIIVSYSRVNIEGCHTWGQVITGSIIGCIFGSIIYLLEKNILLYCI